MSTRAILLIVWSNVFLSASAIWGAQANRLEAVATYTSIGLYWSAEPGISGRASVRYRESGAASWRDAQPLSFDPRQHEVRDRVVAQWRGSIVGLRPGRTYEVSVATGEDSDTVTVMTWPDTHPVGETIALPEHSAGMRVIRSGGKPGGYLIVAPAVGMSAELDVGGRSPHNIVIDAPYVIVRGLRLRGAAQDAIRIGPRAHDVVIEDNDIAGWGRIDSDGFGVDRDAAIGTVTEESQGIRRLTIRRNRIHDPRSGANDWSQHRALHNTSHPLGPHGIFLWDTGGNHVISHNEFFSAQGHLFNDVIGGGANFHVEGAPGSDTDIHGNSISDCVDDGIESEGGNMNVRIWGNRIDRCYIAIAATPTHIGPLYVFRNVALGLRYTPRHPFATGIFLKAQSKVVGDRLWGGGRTHVYHNTVRNSDGRPGAYAAISPFDARLMGVTARNNVFDVTRAPIVDPTSDPSNDYDRTLAGAGAWRKTSRRISDGGTPLANFNDGFEGRGPDLGAEEKGGAPLEFGIPR